MLLIRVSSIPGGARLPIICPEGVVMFIIMSWGDNNITRVQGVDSYLIVSRG